jgi:outer membrane protein assembly factor BamD
MRKFLAIAITLLLGCICTPAWADKYYNQLLKSQDSELKYKAAMQYYEQKDYKKTIRLLEDISSLYKGTEKSENLLYVLSSSYFQRKDYIASAHYYKLYVNTYMRGKHYAECLFMLAYSEYMESPEPELDQRPTLKAIEHFQLFIEQFPYNEQVEQAKAMQKELYDKLAEREYLNAKLYYNLGDYRGNNYRAAIVTAQNAMNDYPDSKYIEELAFIIVKSKYHEAIKSVQEKILDRSEDARDECYYFLQEHPESKYVKDAKKMAEHLQKIIDNSIK